MIGIVYFGAMPFIIFMVALLYHLGIDVLEFKRDTDGRSVLGAAFLLGIWPLVLVIGIIALILFSILVSVNWVAKKVAANIKKWRKQ
jgi:hypothetical protein